MANGGHLNEKTYVAHIVNIKTSLADVTSVFKIPKNVYLKTNFHFYSFTMLHLHSDAASFLNFSYILL